MRLHNINGRLVKKNVSRYLIKWDEKSRSKIQFTTKQFLKPFWFSHVMYEEFPVYGSLLKVDFLNATRRIAVEVNGKQHSEFNKFFHSNSRTEYLKSIKRDCAKAKWLEENNFKLIEIEEDEISLLSRDFIYSKYEILI